MSISFTDTKYNDVTEVFVSGTEPTENVSVPSGKETNDVVFTPHTCTCHIIVVLSMISFEIIFKSNYLDQTRHESTRGLLDLFLCL